MRPFPPKATSLIRTDFRCTEIVKYYYIVPLKRDHPSYKATPSTMKKFLIREVASHERDNVVVFYYLSAFEIWPDKMGGLLWDGSYIKGRQ